MDSKNFIDVEIVIKECGLDTDTDINIVLQNLQQLKTKYNQYELTQVYNALLTNASDFKVLKAVIALADENRDSSTLGPLVDLLLMRNLPTDADKDDVINLRVLCAKSIANHKDTSIVGALLYCLNNKNEHYKVRLACADALGKIGDKYAVTSLINLIQDEDEKSVYLKESAASALGVIGDMRAIDPLVSILESKQGLLDKFSFLKERVIEALGHLSVHDRKIIKALKKSLYDRSPIVRIDAIEAIMNSGEDDAADIIRPCLKDDNEEVQKNALIALYNLEGRDVLDNVLMDNQYSLFLKQEAQDLIDEYEDYEDE